MNSVRALLTFDHILFVKLIWVNSHDFMRAVFWEEIAVFEVEGTKQYYIRETSVENYRTQTIFSKYYLLQLQFLKTNVYW